MTSTTISNARIVRPCYSIGHQSVVDAEAIQRRGRWIRGVMDREANGRDPRDGGRLIRMYRELGLKLESGSNLIESGTLDVLQRMITGRLKVFASLENYLQEFRRYRRDERGQIVTGGDSLQNATRCLVLSGITRMRTEPVEIPEYDYGYRSRGDLDWMR